MNNEYRTLEEMKELSKAFNSTTEEFLYDLLVSAVKSLKQITDYINDEKNQYIPLTDIRKVMNGELNDKNQ